MTEKNKKQVAVEIITTEDSIVEITGSVAWEDLVAYKEKTLKHMQEHAEVDGFRKGKAPLEKVAETYGDMRILSEAAQTALSDLYSKIVIENELKIIGSPDIAITKLAENNPLEYKITTAVFPEITLGDYTSIAKKTNGTIEAAQVEEKEIEEAIEQIKKMNSHVVDPDHEHTEDCNHDNDKVELNDDFVKKLGDFKDVADFKEKLTENIRLQKEREAQAKTREVMMTELIEKSTFTVPELLVSSELDKMIAQMKDDVTRMGLEYNEYLKHMGKTEEELSNEWKPDAKKRAQSELLLKEIARTEEITPDEQKVNQQIQLMKEQYGDEVPEQNMRLYVESIFLNEAVLEFLEGIK